MLVSVPWLNFLFIPANTMWIQKPRRQSVVPTACVWVCVWVGMSVWVCGCGGFDGGGGLIEHGSTHLKAQKSFRRAELNLYKWWTVRQKENLCRIKENLNVWIEEDIILTIHIIYWLMFLCLLFKWWYPQTSEWLFFCRLTIPTSPSVKNSIKTQTN